MRVSKLQTEIMISTLETKYTVISFSHQDVIPTLQGDLLDLSDVCDVSFRDKKYCKSVYIDIQMCLKSTNNHFASRLARERRLTPSKSE